MRRLIPVVVGAGVVLLAAVVLFRAGPRADGLVFWTTDIEPDRMDIQRGVAARFEAKHGTAVSLRPVAEKDLRTFMAQQRAAGTLPHVVRSGIEHIVGYERDRLLDADAATAVIRELGVDSFAPGALDPVRRGDRFLAVPVDGWGQGIWYRVDRFEAAGLEPPTHWPAILRAAEALTVSSNGTTRYGIVLPRHGASQYPQQVFEHLALSAGAHLFADDGSLRLDEPGIRNALDFWKQLAAFSPRNTLIQPADAQLRYLTGRTSMIFYSPYILDDIAGMVEERRPGRPDLAARTGFAPLIASEPGRDGVGYAQFVYLAIMRGAPPETHTWCHYLLDEAYTELCLMSVGGKVPVRPAFLDAWRKHPCFDLYPPDIPDRLVNALADSRRWGFRPGRAFAAISDVYGKHVFARALDAMVTQDLSVDETLSRIRVGIDEVMGEAP